MFIEIQHPEAIPPEGDQILFLEPFTESILGDVHIGFYEDGNFFDIEMNLITGYISHFMEIPCTASIIDKLQEEINKI